MKVLMTTLMLTLTITAAQNRNNCFSNVNVGPQTPVPPTDQFTLELFKNLASSTRKSLFLSPYGIWSALSLAYLGSEGQTLNEMGNVLGLGGDKNFALAALRKQQLLLSADRSGPTLNTLDRAYFANNFQLKKCARDAITDVESIDFGNTRAAAQSINKVVDSATNGKITQIVDPSSLRGARFLLLNAIYFKGTWDKVFNKARTTNVYFTDANQSRNISVIPLMVQPTTTYNYVSAGFAPELGADIVEIPYTGGKFSMLAFLPVVGQTTVDSVLKNLNSQTLNSAISKMSPNVLNLAFPKFKMTTELDDTLKSAVHSMGIQSLFTPSADMSGFTEAEQVYADAIVHKAVLEINEEGTTAAGSTTITATRFGPNKPITVIYNRPFIFMIRHNPTQTTLFAGTYKHPRDAEPVAS